VKVSNPDPLHLARAHIIVAPVLKAGGFGVGVPSHALRDLERPIVRQVVRNPGRVGKYASLSRFDPQPEEPRMAG